ncbi:hypothetical protein [Massilia sp. NR 4-1]|uniref:hypothetical protein n=1 Tax=Massilia sp. NR 4-1 TaxID=1678028 RepID=UPI00123770D0|nr:hypothetical protein [Massilia sp. NR 4-1]
MKKFFKSPWFWMTFSTIVGAISFGVLSAGEFSFRKMLAGAFLGLMLGIVNFVDFYLGERKWTSCIVNGILGGLTTVSLFYILGAEYSNFLYYLIGGIIAGASARIWIDRITF